MTKDEFRKAKSRLNISRAELARKLDMSEVQLYRYEHDPNTKIPKIIEIALWAILHNYDA